MNWQKEIKSYLDLEGIANKQLYFILSIFIIIIVLGLFKII